MSDPECPTFLVFVTSTWEGILVRTSFRGPTKQSGRRCLHGLLLIWALTINAADELNYI